MAEKRIAVMQPYVFPYLGYFQLIHSVDVFVFYDDVNFIKQGWINRNRILVNGEAFLFTIPVEQISSFKEIREVRIHQRNYQRWKEKFMRSLMHSYKKAPYFEATVKICNNILMSQFETISELAESSIIQISSYLGFEKTFYRSSIDYSDTNGMDRADRLIAICKKAKAKYYINPLGGHELYNKDYFKDHGVTLSFIRPSNEIVYAQGRQNSFVPWLSILDVLMFNTPEEIKALLNLYSLE